MDALNRLFSNENAALRSLRDLGLRVVDRAGPLKRRLIAEAAGDGAGAPRLLRGWGCKRAETIGCESRGDQLQCSASGLRYIRT